MTDRLASAWRHLAGMILRDALGLLEDHLYDARGQARGNLPALPTHGMVVQHDRWQEVEGWLHGLAVGLVDVAPELYLLVSRARMMTAGLGVNTANPQTLRSLATSLVAVRAGGLIPPGSATLHVLVADAGLDHQAQLNAAMAAVTLDAMDGVRS